MKTFLKVLSILMIIGAAFSIFTGIAAMAVGGGSVYLSADPATGLDADTQTAVAAIGAFGVVLGVLALIIGIFNLITGIFGIKGSNGNEKKLHTATILGWISLALCVINSISTLTQQNANVLSAIVGVVLPALFVYACIATKKELATANTTETTETQNETQNDAQA